jgi:membrane-associated phospholipid phosphatase
VRPRRPDARFGARASLTALGLLLAAVPFGLLLLLVQSRWDPLLDVDDGARDGLHGFAVDHAWFVDVMKALSFSGSGPVYTVVFAAVAAWLVLGPRLPRLAVFVLVTVAGSAILNGLVKATVDRARPVLPDPVAHAAGLSFPSGHAQSAMVAYSVLVLVFLPMLHGAWRAVAIGAAAFMVLAIGFSRVALGVHFVSDVLAGYVLGAAWVSLMAAAFAAWRGPGRARSPG